LLRKMKVFIRLSAKVILSSFKVLIFQFRCALSVIKLKYKILYRREALVTIQVSVLKNFRP
jgi:hypothetical protein